MELLFCDVCNESVPEKDLAVGRAVRRKGRVVCAGCEGAMSHEAAAPAEAGGSEATSGAAAPPAPTPPRRPETATSRGGGASGVFLGAVALATSIGGIAFLHDRIETEQQERRDGLVDLRASISALPAQVESSVMAEVEDLALELERARSDLAELRKSIEAVAREERERSDGMRSDLTALGQRLAAVETYEQDLERIGLEIQQVGRFTADLHEQQLRIAERVESVREDLGSVRELASVDVGALLGDEAAAPAPPEEERPAWLDFVGDLKSQSASVRWQAVQSIGQSGDQDAAEYLAPMLKDPDIFVRMAAARNLGDLAALLGIPALIDALEDPEESVRESAAVSLRAVTSEDFRFDPGAKESDRAKAVARWRSWWEGARDDVLGAVR